MNNISVRIEHVTSDVQKQKLSSRLKSNPAFMFFHGDTENHDYLVALDARNNPVGLLAMTDHSVDYPDYLELSYCEVEHKSKGIGRQLVHEFFLLANARQLPVTVTHYEKEGVERLKPLVQEYARQYKIYVHEQGLASDLEYEAIYS